MPTASPTATPTATATNTPIPEATPVGRVEGIVFSDRNGNEDQDEGEIGIPGVRLDLEDIPPENVVLLQSVEYTRTTSTDSVGRFVFAGVPDGRYRLTVTPPSGYESVGETTIELTVDCSKPNTPPVQLDLSLHKIGDGVEQEPQPVRLPLIFGPNR
jgi:hypothetical protein